MACADTYFRPAPLVVNVVVAFGLFYLIGLMAYHPAFLIYGYHLGPFGQYLHDLALENQESVRKFFNTCMCIHGSEAVLALGLALFWRQLTFVTSLKWSLSTFITGYFSLRMLIWPELGLDEMEKYAKKVGNGIKKRNPNQSQARQAQKLRPSKYD
eukprot:maker-scaffold1060_size66001-snap-gene-0.10 protein:Tk09438 transcript:maker-scaffold1060_size66001-snap-gene-0.10-mRNA-1 annotation:"transmembrane protein 254-like"